MGSRKDLIKRSLGITEYPWSSDDELEAALGPEDHHELPPESHPDAPGPSGLQSQQPLQQQQVHPQQHQPQQQQHQPQQQHQAQQQQPQTQQQLQQHHQMMQQQLLQQQQFQHLQQQQHQQQQHQQHHQQHNAPGAARRNQSRMDRDIFWSIINRNSAHARSRSGEMPTYVSRVNHIPAAELRERGGERAGAIDIHSLLAFKRLSRNLSSIRSRGAHLAGVIPVTRVNPGVIVPSEANSSIRINRHIPIRRFVRAGPVPITTRLVQTEMIGPDGHMVVIPGGPARAGGSRAHARRRGPAPPPDMQRGPPPDDMPEDEVNNNPLPPTEDAGLLDDVNVEQDLPLEGEMEVEPHDNSASFSNSSAAVTEDDIVAIDLDNSDVHAQLEAQNEQEEREEQEDQEVQAERELEANAPPAVDIDLPSTSDATDAAVTEQPSRVSRRRRPEETPEPYTVKEFNQNLLRLLECPVCLEWMEPPMSQCRRGHLVCGRCRARLASCPVCRTTFSSVRNRAMEGVAEMLRYPCRHGCGREVRLRRRAPHEASCAARQYQCPAPLCAGTQPLPRAALASHFQSPQESSSRPVEGGGDSSPPPPDEEGSLLSPDPHVVEISFEDSDESTQPSPPPNGPHGDDSEQLPSLPNDPVAQDVPQYPDDSMFISNLMPPQHGSGRPPIPGEGRQPAQQPYGPLMPYLEAMRLHAVRIANESRHLPMLKIGRRHKFSMKVNSELHDNWLVSAMEEYFHLRIDVDIRTWGVILYVSYIGPKCDAKNYIYEVTIDGQHNQRKLVYSRTTHSDLESSSLNVSRQDCFHLTLDQALNFIRFKNRHCDAEKFLDFNVELSRVEHPTPRDDSDS